VTPKPGSAGVPPAWSAVLQSADHRALLGMRAGRPRSQDALRLCRPAQRAYLLPRHTLRPRSRLAGIGRVVADGVGPEGFQDGVVGGVADGEEPLAAAVAVKPPFLLGSRDVLAGVEIVRPLPLARRRLGTRV